MITRLSQRGKPIIIDELGTTAINFTGEWSQDRAQTAFYTNTRAKNTWIKQRKQIISQYPQIVAIVYFNLDPTGGARTQVLGQADRSLILSPFIDDYSEGKKFLTQYGDTALNRLFVIKKRPPLQRSL